MKIKSETNSYFEMWHKIGNGNTSSKTNVETTTQTTDVKRQDSYTGDPTFDVYKGGNDYCMTFF